MSKYLELVEGSFTQEHFDKQESQIPYVAYSVQDNEVIYNIVPNEDGYNLITLKKVDISNISYEEVDLGLESGLKWANKNIGAQTVEDYGTYFSWGNTDGYTVSGTRFLTVDETCQLFSSVTGQTVTTKEELETILLSQLQMTMDNIGIIDGYSFDNTTYNGTSGANFSGDTLDPAHDAATSIVGDGWRTPTIDEYKELVNAVKTSAEDNEHPLTCTYIYLDKQGNRTEYVVYRGSTTDYFNISLPEHSWILGIKFTNVYTDTFVYFPVCGYGFESILIEIGRFGRYWSSSIDDTTNARLFDLDSIEVSANYGFPYRYGLCVRAVKV